MYSHLFARLLCNFEYNYYKQNVTAVTTNTRPQRFFLWAQTCVLVDVNQPLPWFFKRWPITDSFRVSGALERTCLRLNFMSRLREVRIC